MHRTFDMVGEKDRKPRFYIFVVYSDLIVGGVWWHRAKNLF